MCDFHSVIVSTDGRVFHLPENSHSGIASHYELTNTPELRQFYECEWDGRGEMPGNLVNARHYGAERDIPALVQRTADRHYTKLAAILSGELSADETHPFNLPEYSDVRERPAFLAEEAEREERRRIEAEAEHERRRVAAELKAQQEAEAEELAEAVATLVDKKLATMSAEAVAHFVRQLADANALEIGDVFAEELEEATETAETEGREAGYDDGYDAAADEMYSADYVSDNIEDFINQDEWVRVSEVQSAEDFAEFYAKRFAAGRIGSYDTLDKARTSNST